MHRARVIRWLAVAIELALVAAPSTARAYCRRSLCDGRVGTRCLPARADDCGTPARWPSACVAFSISEPAPVALGVDGARALMAAAFDAWQAADCGGGAHPALNVTHQGPVACTKHEYNRELGNANVVVFHAGAWPGGDGAGQLALTSLSYGAADGAIYDGDIEFNWHELQGMALPSIALHEAGHFLGLAHSEDPASVMNEDVHGGAATNVTLAADDVRAICASYPPAAPGLPAPSCDATPRNGLRSTCAAAPPVPRSSGRAWLLGVTATLVALVGALGLLRRRRL